MAATLPPFDAIKSLKYDVIIINFANPDMVGHTGILDAAVKAVEAVDECVGKAYDALLGVGGQIFLFLPITQTHKFFAWHNFSNAKKLFLYQQRFARHLRRLFHTHHLNHCRDDVR